MIDFVEVERKRIRYLKIGTGEPIVLIHGLGSSMIVWQQNIEALARNFTVYALDLPGHGYSSPLKRGELNLEFSSRFLESFFTALGFERFVCVGSSLGGLIALRYTLDYPSRVKKLVLIGSAGLGRSMGKVLRLMSLPVVGEFFSGPNPRFVQYMLESLVYDKECIPQDLIRELVHSRANKKLRQNMLGLLRYGVSIRGQKRHIVHVAKLSSITVPTLLLWGENDPVFPVEQAHSAIKHFPSAILRVFPQTGHLLPLERPAEFNKAILEFSEGGKT